MTLDLFADRISAWKAPLPQPVSNEECLDLYKKWAKQKAPVKSPSEVRLMLEDSFSAHKRVLEEADSLGLRVRVLRVNGRIVAYPAGFPFREEIFCVLLEVADREIQGLSVFLFREFCREVKTFPRIHTMGDSGLEALRKAKLSYHPQKILPVFLHGKISKSKGPRKVSGSPGFRKRTNPRVF